MVTNLRTRLGSALFENRSIDRHAGFGAILVLGIFFRLLAIVLFRPGGFVADASDYDFYYLWGQQIPQGYETFVNLWTAYPPLFPAIMLPIFEWSSRIPPWIEPRLFFHLLFGLVLLLFETGNLILIYRLALKLGYAPLGHAAPATDNSHLTTDNSHLTIDNSHLTIDNLPFTIGHSPSPLSPLLHPALFYALLFTPVYTLLGWFEAMPLFFMLWGLDLLLSRRRGAWLLSAVIAALGFLTKLTPALLVPIAIRWLGSKLSWAAARDEWLNPRSVGNLLRPTLYTLLFLSVIIGGGYWLVDGHTALAFSSFQVNALRPPWESVWALLVDNYDWGRVPVDMRNLPALQNPPPTAQLPWNWITFGFALLYLWLYTRRYDWSVARTPVTFAAISVLWLFLYSKGWSPQFLVWILAFMVLLLPNWHGVLLSIGLSLLNVIESPIYFTMLGNEQWILAAVILLRTSLLLSLTVALCGQIWPVRGPQLQRFATAVTAILFIVLVVGFVGALPRAARAYADQRFAGYRCAAAVTYLREEQRWPNQQIVSDQIDLWRDLYPWLYNDYTIHVIDGYDPTDRPWDEMIQERLTAYVGNQEFWWITYSDQPTHADGYFAQPTVHSFDEQQLGACQLRRVIQLDNADTMATFATDGGPIQLKGISLGDAKVGEELHLVLYWQSDTAVTTSYTVFVQLLDGAGQLVTQQDNLPVTGLAPTNTWQPTTVIRDPYRLSLPESLAPGKYQLHVGMYTAAGRVNILASDQQSEQLVFDVKID